MEDLMVRGFGYWAWSSGGPGSLGGPVFGAPLQNSFGWLVTATLAAAILGDQKSSEKKNGAAIVLAAYCFLMTETAWLGGLASSLWWTGCTAAIVAFTVSGKEQASQ